QFERKWNSTTENEPFVPLPPTQPAYASPANSAIAQPATNLTLKWEGGPWTHKYDIYLGATANPPLLVANASTFQSGAQAGQPLLDTGSVDDGVMESYTITTPLQPGTTYFWKVVGKTMANQTASGPVWSFTTSGTGAAPAAPTGLTATAVSPSQINLAWADVGGETGYRVERSPNGSTSWVEIASLAADQVTYQNSQLASQQTYFYRVRAANSSGFSPYSNVASATTPATPPPGAGDIVLWAAEAPQKVGAWSVVADATAAGGNRISNPDAGAPKRTTALANPTDYFEMTFNAPGGTNYRLWLRGKAQNDLWSNDSVFIQFSDSVDSSSGSPVFRIGTTGATEMNLEDCSGCGLQGWGWQDNGWGVGVFGPIIKFQTTGTHTIRIQVREDGLSIDQILLSPDTYGSTAPGPLKNDNTILPKSTGGGGSPSAPAPAVSSILPTSGPTAGGTSITISGSGFVAGATVSLGGTLATNVNVVNSNSITATTAPRSAGVVDVVVTNPDTQTGTLVQGFSYSNPQASPPAFDRVVIVALENQSFANATGGMPFLNKLANRYGLATNYFGNTHPSIGDYFWLTTGQGITNDSNFAGTVSADNIVRQLNLVGKSWRAYAENLPSIGYTGGDQYPYVKRHNPFSYLSDVTGTQAQANNLVPFSQFAIDLSNNQLPNYSFIIPNQYNNSHDCPPSIPNCTNADKLTTADQWLKDNIDPLIASAAFRQNGLLVITFDESVDTDIANGGGHVITVVISPKAKQAFQSNTLYQHQSLLRLAGEALGVGTHPGAAATAPNMAEFFTTTPNTAPIISGLSPTSGPAGGGTTVTISGTGFATGATVSFGGAAASNVNVVGSTTITAVTPAHASGPVNVVVTNPGGQSATSTNGYSYAATAAPTVTDVSPTSGPTTGGTSITV
ncbi:MAG TPA: IPT/TIG domain-containing protein, partial [Pyrinomonadaceae bacterium]|nr:IPT/TIG domain-containing protein [Pyrinomonadaceae bacterium]